LFRPKLSLEFGSGADYQPRTPEQFQGYGAEGGAYKVGFLQAEYVRVKVQNVSSHPAKGCRPYLVNVERRDHNAGFRATDYCDTIPLPWSCRGNSAYDAIEIPPRVSVFFDVVSVREGQVNIQLQTLVIPLRYMRLASQPATYRFTVQVAGEELNPKTLRLCVEWNGAWDTIKTWLDSSQ
jgi:hypothetical protein